MSKEYNQSNHTHQYSVSPQNHARHSNDGFKRKAGNSVDLACGRLNFPRMNMFSPFPHLL